MKQLKMIYAFYDKNINENGDEFLQKISWKGGALIAPIPPALVSCGTMEKPNALTIAWTGILNTIPPKTYISVRPTRYSYDLIKSSGEFVINLTTSAIIKAADFCGVRSGRNVDKFALTGLIPEKASIVACPMIKQSPVSLECRVSDIVSLGSHDMFIADIIAVNVDEQFIDKEGKLHLDKCGLAAFAHGEYFELGKKIGTFGFSVRKKNKKHK
jgi:flavin reductase (DIM6/NTAB) family NADH-FMN oxidoreductase RutF